MHILIYGLNYAPELVGVGKYTGEMAEWLAQQGHEVIVITAPPYYPHWLVQKPYRAWAYSKEKVNDVHVYRCPLWIPHHPSGFRRLIHHFSFSLCSCPVLFWFIRRRPDVVVTIEPSFFTAVITAMLSYIFNFKSWLHVQDFELDAALSLGILSSKSLTRWATLFEKLVMKQFDRVSSISESMVNRLHKKGIGTDKSRFFPNWVDAIGILPLGHSASLRSEWNIPDTSKVVLYSGNMGEKQGLEVILKIAKELVYKRSDILFLLVGDGVVRQTLERIASEEKLTNIRFMPLQPVEKLAMLLATADVHLVIQRRGAADLVMPSKLAGIFAAGGVSLVTADPGTELFRIVHDNKLGLVVLPESTDEILKGLLLLLDNSELRQIYQERARAYAECKLEKSKILKEFETHLLDLIGV